MTVCRLLEDDAGVALRVSGDWVPTWEVPTPTTRPESGQALSGPSLGSQYH